MTIKRLLIIFLSLMLAISCSNDATDPMNQQQENPEQPGGGGHLNDYGNGSLIEGGSSDAGDIASFINKYAGVYYESGKVTYKLKDGKLYENQSWDFTEITEGIIVQPNGNKMQISNRGGLGTIEVLNFRREGDGRDGFSSYSAYILTRDTAIDTSMSKVGKEESLRDYSGTFKELSGSAFLSIDSEGNIYFKEAVTGSGRVYTDNGNLVIVDNSNNKNVVQFKEGVYRKYTRSSPETDTTVNSSSVTTDFIEDLGETKYDGGIITIEFNKFDAINPAGVKEYPGGVKIYNKNNGIYTKAAKTSILKGKTLTVYDNGSKVKVAWTLTFNDDYSAADFVQNGQTTTLTKQ